MKKLEDWEVRKYEEGLEAFKKEIASNVEPKEKYSEKLEGGIIAETDAKNNTITLINKNGERIELNSLLPEGYVFEFENSEWRVDSVGKKVPTPVILNEAHLIICLHEMGHAVDYSINQYPGINHSGMTKEDRDKFLKENNRLANQERNAWAWALKKIFEFQKQGFISDKITKKRLMEIAKISLYSHAKASAKYQDPGSGKFLNKEL